MIAYAGIQISAHEAVVYFAWMTKMCTMFTRKSRENFGKKCSSYAKSFVSVSYPL